MLANKFVQNIRLKTEPNFLHILPDESLSITQSIKNDLLDEKKIGLDVKREDLIHPYLSGNKWRKLKYNIAEAQKQGKTRLLTFGGAHSNHIYATAAAGKLYGFETIGIIRGDELMPDNETLAFAKTCNMMLKFLSRAAYRLKAEGAFLEELEAEFGDFYWLPEGGTNALAIEGCEEIVSTQDFAKYDYVALMMGTGGTISGVLNASNGRSHIIGISALKGEFMKAEIDKLNDKYQLKGCQNYTIFTQFHHGGYGKNDPKLEVFINKFMDKTEIPVEYVYTGKLFHALFDLAGNDFFKPNSKILAIHTGGLRHR
ncbi:MAG: 1-aminocyclopropane-1-carboxylate deaminase/D-cysteine desulfhydrase [Cytophagales bacterium]